MALREQLIAARPEAMEYADSLRAYPSVVGLRAWVHELLIYPVKALGKGLSCDKVVVGSDGLQSGDGRIVDRAIMLMRRDPGTVTQTGEAYDGTRFSQREEGRLVLPTPSYDPAKKTLTYVAPDMDIEPLVIQADQMRPQSGHPFRVKMFSKGTEVFTGVTENGPIADWVRRFLSKLSDDGKRKSYAPREIEVLIPHVDFPRPVEDRHRRDQDARTRWTDGGQELLVSKSTAEWVSDGVVAAGGEPVPVEAYRGNIVLAGLPKNVEDVVDAFRISTASGSVRLLCGDMSVRCDVTKVDQRTGAKQPKQPLAFLAKERAPRPDDKNSATFGINVVFPTTETGAEIAKNDEVIVDSEKP